MNTNPPRPDMLFQPRSMSVVLVACGFNANGQLLPFADTLERGPSHNIPDDITEPSIVASGNRTANVLFAGWSDTLRRHMIIVRQQSKE